ncbi:hypothetical protein FDP41_004024 [Naegleria fowleri]|uniref:Uncharacterized protein n=1 Tax=Naegleria fowleri TaxID=5763 RepID=A0A6A5BUY2_NAEFO|nr:uncharacterized protein FDP41_004024 [Naegleria fowleri]KAF0976729.1 hypothetical protein FDP41_004024 [Naegleria fowleri]
MMEGRLSQAFSEEVEKIKKLSQESSWLFHEYFKFSPNRPSDANNNLSVNDPTDIQISYQLNIILITDYDSSKIEVFDLETKEHKASISFLPKEHPRHLCIEENYDGENNDAMILCCAYDNIFKYDLKQFLSNAQSSQDIQYIWKNSDCRWAQGLTISYTTRQLYVCDHGAQHVMVLNLRTGEYVYKFPVKQPFGLTFVENEQYLLVSQVSIHKVEIFKKETFDEIKNTTEWNSIKTIGQYLEMSLVNFMILALFFTIDFLGIF